MALTLLPEPSPVSALSTVIQGLIQGQSVASLLRDVAFQLNPIGGLFLGAYQLALALGLTGHGTKLTNRVLRMLELLKLTPYEAAALEAQIQADGYRPNELLGHFVDSVIAEHYVDTAELREPPSELWLYIFLEAQAYINDRAAWTKKVEQAFWVLQESLRRHGKAAFLKQLERTQTPYGTPMKLLRVAAGFPG